ncbi:hypothetical protein IAG25_40150 [Caballeronia sp. EK]|uniref:hypothetical protein n=1 Tax=Caballeronia sp. EK TaxID=2767469 RepID=UPI0016552187|nr:hypothetical protein [Caballeronia sp. EK]MBC8642970.1 hypothetical protein [Caballeronia sp. EK]
MFELNEHAAIVTSVTNIAEKHGKPTGHWWTFDRDALADFAKHVAPSAEIAALRERIAGMEKDAERYRWLRSEHFPTADKPPVAQVMWKRGSDDRRIPLC